MESARLSVEELTAHLRRPPTSFLRMDEPTKSGFFRKWNIWRLALPTRPDLHAGVDGINEALARLGMEFAELLGSIPDPDRSVILAIVQTTEDDPEDAGTSNFYFSRQTIRWLATAKAEVGISQYIYP